MEGRQRVSWRVREATDAGLILRLEITNFEALAAEVEVPPVPTKLRNLLTLQARESAPGEWKRLDPYITAARLKCRDQAELDYLFGALHEQGYLLPSPVFNEGQQLVTPAGWEALAPIAGMGTPGVCFVAMAFHLDLVEAYDKGFRPAIEDDCGLRALRLDKVEHNEQITDRILAGIRSAQVVVADFTLQRAGVYFEAGFALGLGRIVVWTCRDNDVETLHFDTRQYNHVVWSTPDDLREKLAARLKATVAVPVKFSAT
jgi:hypothetical protein